MSFSRPAAGFAAAFVLTSLAASSAHAYCRTITEALPASYNPQQGCYQSSDSIFLWWKNACVGFSVQQDASKQVTYDDALAGVKRAFAQWSTAACSGGGNPSITASDNGKVTCDQVEYSEAGPNQHVILFHDDAWPHSDPNNTLALTTVTFDKNTGELYDADMEINTADSKIVVNGAAGSGAFDFDSIVTHEAGHFLGLAHSASLSAVMYAHYKPGSTALTSDDIDGICSIYAANGDRATTQTVNKVVQAVTVAADACNADPRHGFGTACGPVGTPPGTTTSKCSVSAVGEGGPNGPNGRGETLLALGLLALAGGVGVVRRRGATLPPMSLRRRARGLVARVGMGMGTGSLVTLGALGAGTLASLSMEREAQASVSIAVLFDELVRDSTAAVVVTPVEQRSVWENGRIYTYSRVRVERALAGTAAGDGVWIRTMGGTVGDIGQLVDGEAVLTPGQSSLLFVQPMAEQGAGVFVVTARAQGQFAVVQGGDKAQRFQKAGAVGALMSPPSDRIAKITQQRQLAGLRAEAPLAADVLHKRLVEDAARDISVAWTRIHAAR